MRNAEIVEGAKIGGRFAIDDGRSILGDLTISGAQTALYLHDPDFFHVKKERARCIQGILHDRTKITLIDSHVRSSLGSSTRYDESFHFAELIPAYVVTGSHHLAGNALEVVKVTFHVDDAETIFYDFDAIGRVIDAGPLIDEVVAANERRIGRKIPVGPQPEIAYFAGRVDLLNVDTLAGRIRVYHQPTPSHPLASTEAGIRNRTLVELTFASPKSFGDSLNTVLQLLRFLEILAGRPQNVDDLWIGTTDGDGSSPLSVYWSLPPHRPSTWEERTPHPSSILVPIVDDSDRFGAILQRWLDADADRLEARVRFSSGFEQQRSFSIDRLVGAANMFDILPDSAFSAVPPLEADVLDAKAVARRAFRSLAASPERDSILSALGRLGRPTLRSRIRQRAEIVSKALREPLADLDLVVDEAVKCRNYYVHGSPGSFSYAEHIGITTFFTRALEFLFAASDLIDAGWDIAAWQRRSGVMTHPFRLVVHQWSEIAAEIRKLRPN